MRFRSSLHELSAGVSYIQHVLDYSWHKLGLVCIGLQLAHIGLQVACVRSSMYWIAAGAKSDLACIGLQLARVRSGVYWITAGMS